MQRPKRQLSFAPLASVLLAAAGCQLLSHVHAPLVAPNSPALAGRRQARFPRGRLLSRCDPGHRLWPLALRGAGRAHLRDHPTAG